MKKFIVSILSVFIIATNSNAGINHFVGADGDISRVENMLKWIQGFYGCISNIMYAYEHMVANRSIRKFEELEKEHQKKVDEVAVKLREALVDGEEINRKQITMLEKLAELQNIQEREMLFLMEVNNQLQNINTSIRAVGE